MLQQSRLILCMSLHRQESFLRQKLEFILFTDALYVYMSFMYHYFLFLDLKFIKFKSTYEFIYNNSSKAIMLT